MQTNLPEPSLERYPLPLAVLLQRASLAKSPRQMHDYAFWAWDVSVRLRALLDPNTWGSLGEASLGVWTGVQTWSKERTLKDDELHEVVALCAREAGRNPTTGPLSPAAVVEFLASYRNNVIGHGSPRPDGFYETAGHVLRRGIEVAWQREIFWTGDLRLVFTAADASRISLMGVMPSPLEPTVDSGGEGIGIVGPEGVRPIHPWLLLDRRSARQRVLVFNGSNRGGPSYLDFDSGETIRGAMLRDIAGDVRDPVPRGDEPPSGPVESDIPDLTVLGPVGEGGMGVVELARHSGTGAVVALKQLPPTGRDDVELQRRIASEIKALFRCDHRNVVRLLSYGRDAREAPYFTMELIEGPPLAMVRDGLMKGASFAASVDSAWSALRARTPSLEANTETPATAPSTEGPDSAWRLPLTAFAEGAEALAYLHGLGVLHRDISPGNILFGARDKRVVLIDFGLARLADATGPASTRSRLIGTYSYMAPERRLGEPGDERSDVFSLAATFQSLLFQRDAGRSEHSGATRAGAAASLKAHTVVVARLCAVLDRALANEPKNRYPSASALASDLRLLLSGRRPRVVEARIRRRVAMTLAAVAVVGGAVFAASTRSWSRTSPAPSPSAHASTPGSRLAAEWAYSNLCQSEWQKKNYAVARKACLDGLVSPTLNTEPSLHYNLARVEEATGNLAAARGEAATSLSLRANAEVQGYAERLCASAVGPPPASAKMHIVRWKPKSDADLAVVRNAPSYTAEKRDDLSFGTCVWVTGPLESSSGGSWAPLRYRSPADDAFREGWMHIDLLGPRPMATPTAAPGPACAAACCGGSGCKSNEVNRRTLADHCGDASTCDVCPSGATCVAGDCAEPLPAGRYGLRLADVFGDQGKKVVDIPRYETLLVCFSKVGSRRESCVPLARTRAERFGVPVGIEATADELVRGVVQLTLREPIGHPPRATWGTHSGGWSRLLLRDLCVGHVVTLDNGPLSPKNMVRVFLDEAVTLPTNGAGQ